MNQSINTDSKNIKEPQQKYRLGTVSIKILGVLNKRRVHFDIPSQDDKNKQICSLWGFEATYVVLQNFCDFQVS